MTDKASQDDCCQVVFLIDSNPSFWGCSFSSVEAANAIQLCVLKILTYFADYGKRRQSILRWGYKFFSSRSLLHQFERHEFKEFTLNVFEEFENLVSKRLSESFAQQLQGSLVEQSAQDGDEFTKLNKAPVAAKCISCAFTNTVHDFQWDRPDITSPVRRTRGNNVKSLTPGNSRTKTQNVMFLLSGCPCDEVEISYFTGEISSSLATLESLNNILMPSVLYKEFKERHICLHWVNTGNYQYEKNTTVISLLESFVEQLNGCLIPLSAVVYSGSFSSLGYDSFSKNHSSCNEVKKTFPTYGLLFPSKTVMDFFLAGKAKKLSDVNSAQYQHDEKMGYSGTTALLCSSGIDDKIHCSVQLNSMFQPTSVQPNPRGYHEVANDVCDGPTNSLTANKATETFQCCPTLLWIRGVINHSCICPTWLHPMKAYTCIGLDCRQTDESTNSASCFKKSLSGWFQQLLLSLAKENKLLVIDFIDCGLLVSSVLQPLTSICGVISVISSDFIVKFEKLLLWSNNTAVLDRGSIRSLEGSSNLLREVRDKTACKPAGQAAKPTEVFVTVPRSEANLQDAADNDSRKYEAGLLDPWLSFPVFDSKKGLAWREPRSPGNESQEGGDDSNETSLMKQLKVLYSSKEEKPKTIVLKEKRSPRHSKEKSATSKKLKLKKDSLQLSENVVKEVEKADQEGAKQDQSTTQPFAEENISGDNFDVTGEVHMTGDTYGMQELPEEIKDDVQLVKAIDSICNKVIFEGVNVLTEVTNIMTAVSRFYQNNDRQKDCVAQFLKENILQTISKLRGKYEGCDAIVRKEQQVREYQLQILLWTEIAVLVNADGNSALVEEVTVLLRTMSFVKDPNFLTVYLREVLLDRYSRSLPKFLCGVYEGLMMRPPREVLSPSKWFSDDESPVRRSINSVSSVKQDSDQPRSSGCRILTRHMSISDVAGKRREIVVPAKAKPKEKEKKKKDKSQGNNNSKGESKKQEKTSRGQKTPVKLVRRNLFMESEGADENKSTDRVPRKRKLSEGGKKDESGRRFHRRNTVGSFSTAAVQETPAHKQVSNALWCKQDRARKRSRFYSEVHVLQESPLKELQAVDSLPCRSPRRHLGVIFQRSQSFYGNSASAGPLTRTRSFTGVRPCRSPEKEPTEPLETSAKKTPQKLTFAAVSPLRFSPRHRRKFSLHSLLTTAKECDQKEDSLQRRQKPTTPKRQIMAPTRSSPRLLKKRSFSCIGFSSVPFPGDQELGPDGLDECVCLLTPFRNPFKSPVPGSPRNTGDTQPHYLESPKQLDRLPQAHDDNPRTPMINVISPAVRSSARLLKKCEKGELAKEMSGEKSTSSNIAVMTSPNSSSLKGHTQPHDPESSKQLDRLPQAHDGNPRTPMKNVISPPVRRSPKLLKKHENGELSKDGESLCKSTDSKIVDPVMTSPSSSKQNSTLPKAPVRDHHVDECVVLLTPLREPLTSPVHKRPRDVNGTIVSAGVKTSNINELTQNCESFQVAIPTFKSPLSLSRHQSKRLSLKLRKRSPMSERVTKCMGSTSKGTEWFSCLMEESQENCKISSTPPPSSSPPAAGQNSSEAQFKSPGSSRESPEKGGHDQVPSQFKSPDSIRASPSSRGLSPVTQLKSPHSSGGSPASRRLLQNQSPQHSTPPVKKGKRKRRGYSIGVSNSGSESKSSSPLNQLLRQQKRKRCFSSSPVDKCSSEAIHSHMLDTPSEKARTRSLVQSAITEELGLSRVPRPIAIEDNTSRSSEEDDGWLTEIEKIFEPSFPEENKTATSPPKKKQRIDKSVVFGGKHTRKEKKAKKENANSSLSSDTSFEEEDDVFQSPAATASSLRRRHMNKTPLSASSIKILQESPLLCNSTGSKLTVSSSSRLRNFSDLSPKSERHGGKVRLSLRKLRVLSSHNEAGVSDAFVDDQEEPTGFNLGKRPKVSTS